MYWSQSTRQTTKEDWHSEWHSDLMSLEVHPAKPSGTMCCFAQSKQSVHLPMESQHAFLKAASHLAGAGGKGPGGDGGAGGEGLGEGPGGEGPGEGPGG